MRYSYFLIIFALISSHCFAASSDCEKFDYAAGNSACSSKSQFTHLAKFNDKKNYPYYDTLMQDNEIQGALMKLMGTDYKNYRESTRTIEIQDPLVDDNGTLHVYGALPDAYTITESALIVNPSGLIYVAVLQNGNHVSYYTNDTLMAHKLPAEFLKWSSRFNHLPVFYKSQ